MEWWTEIRPPGEVPRVQFGGPTGMYSLVVLLSWWCTLLAAKPDKERVECLRVLEDVDRVLVMTLDDLKKNTTTPPSAPPSPTTPLPYSQSRKRANVDEFPPRKRKRYGQD